MGRRTSLVLLLICLAVFGWELLVPSLLLARWPGLSDIPLYSADKLSFAAMLAVILSAGGRWRRCGFAGGVRLDHFGLLWPFWLAAALAALQGVARSEIGQLFGWLAIAAAVGFGEEGVFRGLAIAAIGLDRPRRAIAVSSLLFGGLHLVGLLAPIDYRYVLAQTVVAICLGLVLGCVRVLAQSIWPGIIAHAILDFFGLAAAGSVDAAMNFSIGTLIVLGGSAAIALAWASVLWRRLPR